VKREYLVRTYGVHSWTDGQDFLVQLALRGGKLLRGGEPDLPLVAKNVINDFQRGKLPFFSTPPDIKRVLLPAGACESAWHAVHAVAPAAENVASTHAAHSRASSAVLCVPPAHATHAAPASTCPRLHLHASASTMKFGGHSAKRPSTICPWISFGVPLVKPSNLPSP
jgi:hypothetical protein